MGAHIRILVLKLQYGDRHLSSGLRTDQIRTLVITRLGPSIISFSGTSGFYLKKRLLSSRSVWLFGEEQE